MWVKNRATNTHAKVGNSSVREQAGAYLISLAISSSASHSLLKMKTRNRTRATRPITEPKVAPAISQALLAAEE